MKNFAVAAFALTLAFGANAQESATLSSTAGSGFANLTAFGVAGAAAVGVTAAVAAAIISNAQAEGVLPTAPPVTPPATGTTTVAPPTFVLVCNEGDAAPVAGVCTTNSSTVTVTGTGTATSTITVPVTITYPAIVTSA
ncbi:hypothetical protein JAO78_004405 [Alishewanella sp. 16-MA]|uniref:Uncharacterized protein n=1 Tax=Alishewanella maricola TaxID=2795740 RepID=A0ABS8C1Q6_9ALTE|nr:hypothetical protein [Alishewanella maricola]MCB5226050.1 hypothetical protein [Alishewanella maricola]